MRNLATLAFSRGVPMLSHGDEIRLGMLIHGEASDDPDERGRPNRGQALLLLPNASNRAQHYALPKLEERGHWQEAANTAQSAGRAPRRVPRTGVNVAPHSLVLLWYEVS